MGLVLYCGLVVIGSFLVRGRPVAEAVFWLLLALQTSNAAWTFWQKAHLLAPTLALGSISLVAWSLAASSFLGVPFDTVATNPWLLAPLLFTLVLVVIYARRAPVHWEAWQRAAARASFVDILLSRHVPTLS